MFDKILDLIADIFYPETSESRRLKKECKTRLDNLYRMYAEDASQLAGRQVKEDELLSFYRNYNKQNRKKRRHRV